MAQGAYLLSDGNQELQSLGINISDLDTTLATWSAPSKIKPQTNHLLGEQDPITFSSRVDTDVVLGVGGVRTERLNDECVESTSGRFNSLGFTSTSFNPRSSLFPFLVQTQESGLSSSLDELIGFTD